MVPSASAEETRRKLHQPVGVVQPRHAASHEERREDGVDEERYICPMETPKTAGPIRRRMRQTPASRYVQAKSRQQFEPVQERHLERELEHAAHQHRPGERHDRRIEIGRGQQRKSDEGHVEQRRCERGHREAAVGVEHAAGEGGERDEQDVGEGDAEHRHGDVELVCVRVEPGCAHLDDERRGENADRGHRDQSERTAVRQRGRPAPASAPRRGGSCTPPAPARRPVKMRLPRTDGAADWESGTRRRKRRCKVRRRTRGQ